MDYIINPMWFYWMSVVSDLKGLCAVVACLLSITTIVFAIVYTICAYSVREFPSISDDEKAVMEFIRKTTKPLVICLALSLMGTVFIPSQETLITMKVAEFATYENAEITIDTIKSAVDYIVEASKTIGG